MKSNQWQWVVLRNVIGLSALLLVHYISDRYYLHTRVGARQFTPYVFLLALYGWIVFHNRVLFERLYLKNRKRAYLGWTLLFITISSFNLAFILIYMFDVYDVLPKIVSLWVYTLAGLGVFAVFTYVKKDQIRPYPIPENKDILECQVDGTLVKLPVMDILYIESYENYVKIFTEKKILLTRLPMKQAEERLPKEVFVRISRSHIVNISQITSIESDSLIVHGTILKIGKVYKRYVGERMTAIAPQ